MVRPSSFFSFKLLTLLQEALDLLQRDPLHHQIMESVLHHYRKRVLSSFSSQL